MFANYKNIDGDSNAVSYEIGPNYIFVKFYGTNKIYTYTYQSAGVKNVENMKVLARVGNGLNSYINNYCKNLYIR